MRKYFKYILYTGLLNIALTSCNSDDKITPSEITNLTSETRAGEIVLRWTTPEDESIDHIRVSYQDPYLKKEVIRLASIYADSILIPDTRARYSEYEFTVQTVSTTDTRSVAQIIKQKSAPAAVTTTQTQVEVRLAEADLSTNAQEASEGPIKNLLDDNKTTFFHTDWHGNVPAPHWMQVKLNKTLDNHYKFYYAPRGNGSNKPTNFDILGSMDGINWTLIKNFTKEEDGLPVTSSEDYTSLILPCTVPFNQIRFVVHETNSGSVYWTMSIFKIWGVDVKVYDPETDEEEW